jgi:hypothetical protein
MVTSLAARYVIKYRKRTLAIMSELKEVDYVQTIYDTTKKSNADLCKEIYVKILFLFRPGVTADT